MALSELGTDAAFYELVHRVLEEQASDEMADRRGGARRPFSALQRIAPCRDGKVPADSSFVYVRCHDLNQTGFSFFLSRPPCFDRMVVAFGQQPDCIYLIAEVLHWHEVTAAECRKMMAPGEMQSIGSQQGPMVLVGCRFVERLQAAGQPRGA